MAAVLLFSAFLFPVVLAFLEAPALVAEASIGSGTEDDPYIKADDSNSRQEWDEGTGQWIRIWNESGWHVGPDGASVHHTADSKVSGVGQILYAHLRKFLRSMPDISI